MEEKEKRLRNKLKKSIDNLNIPIPNAPKEKFVNWLKKA